MFFLLTYRIINYLKSMILLLIISFSKTNESTYSLKFICTFISKFYLIHFISIFKDNRLFRQLTNVLYQHL